ncbi:FliH/SctL family protein [Tunturiibacter gelidoferens]|uniref:Flagellar assembly protein FliH n=2 Tax=Tunturiibacter TaxID=3154218 RepID=A0A7Y9T3E5_9BACT|nr:FliH/SctL family protein [Edaphobacter lichenicola]NYF52212.1 flagellar assembly protein FliH [Edaphobacter lichenicola]
MMISPSENAGTDAVRSAAMRLPERLVKPSARSVSRLEFYPVDRQEPAAEIVTEDKIVDVETLLKEEEALDGRLRSQAEQMSAQVGTARSEAVVEARLLWEAELEERIAKERSQLQKVEEEFFQERTRYFAGVEGEVVKLALAIAARVLHREAKLDPLLLTGVVRVALEKVAKDSAVVLRVPAGEVEMWQGVFAANQESALKLVGDERLVAGECVLETNVGRVELGVSAQLEEIERGFFDLMQQRPA